jgi:Family of unknown function (DUF6221)
MSDLVAFLRARLDEDEVSATPGRRALDDLRFELKHGDRYEQHLSSRLEDGLDSQTVAWEARVLREVEAKRAIVENSHHNGVIFTHLRPALLHLAAVYADHPDYDPEWKP